MQNRVSYIEQETAAAKALIAALRADGLSDEVELVADMVEAETDLLEAIDLAVAEMDEVEALAFGLKEKERQFCRRRQMLEERSARLRALIEQAMATTEQRTLRRPSATLTLRKLPPQIVVLAEADIPSEYFVPQPPPPPKLDTKRLREALLALRERAGRVGPDGGDDCAGGAAGFAEIPGVILNNGGQSLQIRRA